jgi:hypothetical protein
MSDSEKRSFGQIANTWVQTIGIVLAAAWGIYTFVYEKIILPKAAPINTTMTLQVKRIDVHVARKVKLIPVEVRVTATNPSPRTIYLLSTLWTAHGETLSANNAGEDAMLSSIMESANNRTGENSHKYASLQSPIMVGGGNLFSDEVLRPGETISTTILIFVPMDKFDLIEVHTYIPTVTKSEGIRVKWQLAEKEKEMRQVLYWQRGDKQEPIRLNPDGAPDAPGYEFQTASTSSQLSLWQ